MPLSSIGEGSFHNGGGSFANVGFIAGLILPHLEIFWLFVGLHFFPRAADLLRVQIFDYACGFFISRGTLISPNAM